MRKNAMDPKTIEEIYKYIRAENGEPPSLEETKLKYLPDVSKYKGKILCTFYINFHRGGVWNGWVLVSPKKFKRLSETNPNINLGEIDGKHSCVERNWKEMFESKIEDPYEINSFMIHKNGLSFDIKQDIYESTYKSGDENSDDSDSDGEGDDNDSDEGSDEADNN